jgi:hypothetical protein
MPDWRHSPSEEETMRLMGVMATACLVGIGVVGAGLTVALLPDIKRYIRMSRM